ncbi:MAG TPA: hypothetical protein VNP95_04280, partial [Thermomicrobiales bacterium]|nr:hypothetical protein [Thermomicrobiales bacterium]
MAQIPNVAPTATASETTQSAFSTTEVLPDALGRFGRFGGVFAPETLMPAIGELTAAYEEAKDDPDF